MAKAGKLTQPNPDLLSNAVCTFEEMRGDLGVGTFPSAQHGLFTLREN